MRAIVIPNAQARAVAIVMERGLAVIERADGAHPPAALYGLLAELRIAASEHIGTSGIPPERPPVMLETVSASAAAEQLGISSRGVTALAKRGTLPGRQGHRGAPWRFRPDDVADYAAQREGA